MAETRETWASREPATAARLTIPEPPPRLVRKLWRVRVDTMLDDVEATTAREARWLAAQQLDPDDIDVEEAGEVDELAGAPVPDGWREPMLRGLSGYARWHQKAIRFGDDPRLWATTGHMAIRLPDGFAWSGEVKAVDAPALDDAYRVGEPTLLDCAGSTPTVRIGGVFVQRGYAWLVERLLGEVQWHVRDDQSPLFAVRADGIVAVVMPIREAGR